MGASLCGALLIGMMLQLWAACRQRLLRKQPRLRQHGTAAPLPHRHLHHLRVSKASSMAIVGPCFRLQASLRARRWNFSLARRSMIQWMGGPQPAAVRVRIPIQDDSLQQGMSQIRTRF